MQCRDFENRPLVIRTNYGDDSIALVQWAFEANLIDIVVAYVDTGWQAVSWEARVLEGEQHARACNYQPIRIQSNLNFATVCQGRGSFPSYEFQWCAGFLKGLPFLDWIDKIDIRAEAIIMIAKRRSAALAQQTTPEWLEACEYHNDRTVWHPLVEVDDAARNELLARAGFSPLGHRSLECEPCVNSSSQDIERMAHGDREKLSHLETELKSSLFSDPPSPIPPLPIRENPKDSVPTYLDLFYRGCGNRFGCGL